MAQKATKSGTKTTGVEGAASAASSGAPAASAENAAGGASAAGQPAPMAVTLGGAGNAAQQRGRAPTSSGGDTVMESGADPLAAAARNDGPRASTVVGQVVEALDVNGEIP